MENKSVEMQSKYKFERLDPLDHLAKQIESLEEFSQITSADAEIRNYLKTHLTDLGNNLKKEDSAKALRYYSSFLPPRLVEACKAGSLVPFFGSGISISAGIPTWSSLLEVLGVANDYISDPHVENDPLTQAELIAHDIGTDALQQKLRKQMKMAASPSLAHYQLAALRLPVYITTNYDSLFEKAWSSLGLGDLIKVMNDDDVVARGLDASMTFPTDIKGKSVLIKMHGDSDLSVGLLILTRSDYRRHYRSNFRFFKLVREIIKSGCVLFLGFGHRDPEVSRLVEDVVYEYEHEEESADNGDEIGDKIDIDSRKQKRRPMYSIQFDMRQRTPEVFAARGLVALRPPLPPTIANLNADQHRSASLAIELGELMAATDGKAHGAISLRKKLDDCVTSLSNDISKAMSILQNSKDAIADSLNNEEALTAQLTALIPQLLELKLAGQGIYVTKSNGDIAGLAVPEGLKKEKRNERKEFGDRPYFRQARTFQKPFVSDVLESIYNKHSTIFLCMPLGEQSRFKGLLFAAAQPGSWTLPVELRDEYGHDGVEFVLVDSNGIAIVPPTLEMKPGDPVIKPEGESLDLNQGFPYQRVQEISRRDSHIMHVAQNVVPVGWDDDVHDVSPDLRLYSMVADVPDTRWKLALSMSVPSTLSKSA